MAHPTPVVLVIAAWLLAGCSPVANLDRTPLPDGYPLNPCPMAGEGAITPRVGYSLVAPGQAVFAFRAWHNETPDTFACGAQSIQGGKSTITAADFPAGALPWVATFRRAVPLSSVEAIEPRVRLLRSAPTGPVVVEEFDLAPGGASYGRMGDLFTETRDPPPGHYRLEVVASTGETLAVGDFELAPDGLSTPASS